VAWQAAPSTSCLRIVAAVLSITAEDLVHIAHPTHTLRTYFQVHLLSFLLIGMLLMGMLLSALLVLLDIYSAPVRIFLSMFLLVGMLPLASLLGF